MRPVKELERKILRHKAYYYQGRPEISDDEYDRLEEKLRKIDPGNPVLSIVGVRPNSSQKIKHDSRMLSLNKTYKLDELYEWIGEEEVVSTYKVDGSSCSVIYKAGKLSLGKTRGDGRWGEDISNKVLWIKDIPKTIKVQNCEVRGEIYCDEKNLFQLSAEMVDLGLKKPSNQRNIVAGLLGRKENIELCRYLRFFAFEMISDELDLKRESDKVELLKKLDFQVPKTKTHKEREGVEEAINATEIFITEGEYLIDGIVFSYNRLELHDELGSTAHHPRFKMAFKFQGGKKRTEIVEIIWTVSRKGHLIPVAKVKQVEISGANISRVTLHNYGQVKQHGLKRGDEIEIIRSGEVIPKFVAVAKSSQNKFEKPNKCPVCETRVEVAEIHLVCPNKTCVGRIKESILNFIRKVGIDDLSSKRLDAMLKQGLVTSIADLYKLDKEKLLTLEKTKEKLATKILDEIKKSKDLDLVVFMSALGISGGAYNKCEKVVHAGFNTIARLKKMSEEELSKVESFAEKSSTEFIASLSTKWELVEQLLQLGLKLKAPMKQGQLMGKKLVITGTLSRKRSDLEKEIKLHGGVVSSSVSKGTDYLVANDEHSVSSKAKKARKLKILIISEDELTEMIK